MSALFVNRNTSAVYRYDNELFIMFNHRDGQKTIITDEAGASCYVMLLDVFSDIGARGLFLKIVENKGFLGGFNSVMYGRTCFHCHSIVWVESL